MSRHGRLLSVSVTTPLLWGLLASGSALAEAPEEAVLRRYEAASDCPDAAVFMSHFASRTTRVRLTSSSDDAQHGFVVMLTHDGGRVVGHLEIHSRDGSVSHREVTGQSCAEVVPALAFVAALTAAPTAQTSDTSLAAGSMSTERTTPTQVQAPAPPPKTPEPATAPWSSTPAPSLQEGRDRTRLEGYRWALLGQVGALLGLFPDNSPYAALFLQLGLPQHRSPGLQLGVVGALSRDHQVSPGYARFQWLTAELGLCPATVRFSDQWSMTPCAIGQLGMLRGIGRGVTNPGEETRWWRAAGANLQLEWLADQRLFLQANGSLLRPLARDEFVMVDEQELVTIRKIPLAVGGIGLGIGLLL